MCTICWAAMRRFRNRTFIFLTGGFCLGDDAIRGIGRFCCTSLANLARHHATSLGVGVCSACGLGVVALINRVVPGAGSPGRSSVVVIGASHVGVAWLLLITVPTAIEAVVRLHAPAASASVAGSQAPGCSVSCCVLLSPTKRWIASFWLSILVQSAWAQGPPLLLGHFC